jgi:hypothetical protein
MSPSSRPQIAARRRIVVRAGFVVIVAASLTACIFDQSTYKGGGRLDKGATANTASATATDTTTAPTGSTAPKPTADAANPLVDAGLTD